MVVPPLQGLMKQQCNPRVLPWAIASRRDAAGNQEQEPEQALR